LTITDMAFSLKPLVFPAALLGALELWTRTSGQSSDALAPPTAAAKALMSAANDGSLWSATTFTMGSAALGLLIGALSGVVLGTLLGLSRRTARAAYLSVEVARPIPSVALIPLAMMVFGFGLRMEVSVVAFACFWPMLVLTQSAVQQVEPQLMEVASALQLSPWQRFIWIIGPAMVPRLFVALRLGVAIALVVAVTVEIAANPNGMGYAMMIAQQSLDPALMLGWLGWIGVVGYAVNAGTLALQQWVARRMGEASV
jgi:ABC-type nitrate/sulfonate/bicarbonate transport system permease component